MSSALIYIYLADVLPRIVDISSCIVGLFMGGVIFYLIYCYSEDKTINLKKIFRYSIFFSIPLLITLTLPSESTLYSIAAVKAGKDIEVSETVQKAIRLINLKLDEALKEENK